MASPNATFTEMVTTTLRNHARELVDNVSDNNALLRLLKEKGKIETESGGYEIARPLEYAENATYTRYSGYDTLSVQASDVISAAKYDWAQAAIHVSASGRELRMNNGPEAMIKLVKARIKNAMNTAANNLSVDLYSDGALSNQIGGLAHILQNAGTGTVGGINASTYPFWQNQVTEMAGTGTWSKSTIKGEMNKLWLKCVRGKDKPDLIVASHDIYSAYEESLQDLQRYADARNAAAGFESLKYKTANVIFDDNTNFGTTAETAFFLNTDFLYLVQHPEAQWTQDDEKKPINQDAVVVPMYWMGQLVCTNRSLQGKLIDAA
jgi:hypothetical protein